jgi:hypothetical protein
VKAQFAVNMPIFFYTVLSQKECQLPVAQALGLAEIVTFALSALCYSGFT